MTETECSDYPSALAALDHAVQLLRGARPNGNRGWDLVDVDRATLIAQAALGEMRRRCYRPEPLLKGGWGVR